MKWILVRPFALVICWLIVAGQESGPLGAQEVSLIAPGGATQAGAEVARTTWE